jgi:hypothetical protein
MNGAGGRDRTDTPLREQVFETCASTGSATPARQIPIALSSASTKRIVTFARPAGFRPFRVRSTLRAAIVRPRSASVRQWNRSPSGPRALRDGSALRAPRLMQRLSQMPRDRRCLQTLYARSDKSGQSSARACRSAIRARRALTPSRPVWHRLRPGPGFAIGTAR